MEESFDRIEFGRHFEAAVPVVVSSRLLMAGVARPIAGGLSRSWHHRVEKDDLTGRNLSRHKGRNETRQRLGDEDDIVTSPSNSADDGRCIFRQSCLRVGYGQFHGHDRIAGALNQRREPVPVPGTAVCPG